MSGEDGDLDGPGTARRCAAKFFPKRQAPASQLWLIRLVDRSRRCSVRPFTSLVAARGQRNGTGRGHRHGGWRVNHRSKLDEQRLMRTDYLYSRNRMFAGATVVICHSLFTNDFTKFFYRHQAVWWHSLVVVPDSAID